MPALLINTCSHDTAGSGILQGAVTEEADIPPHWYNTEEVITVMVNGSSATWFWPKAWSRKECPPERDRTWLYNRPLSLSLSFLLFLSLTPEFLLIPALFCTRDVIIDHHSLPPSLNSGSAKKKDVGPQMHHTAALKTNLKDPKHHPFFFSLCPLPPSPPNLMHPKQRHTHRWTCMLWGLTWMFCTHAHGAHANKQSQLTNPFSPQKHTHTNPPFRGHHRAPYS